MVSKHYQVGGNISRSFRNSLLIGGALMAIAGSAAHAAEAGEGSAEASLTDAGAADAANDAAAAEGDTIIVTGSRAGNLTAEKSLVPISVASTEDLERSGKQNLRDALSAVLPSYLIQAGGYQGQQGAGVRGARLRGLDAKDTLILVNGVRRHTTSLLVGTASPTDLDLIPSNAIERIEVLGNGAASLYGSDAIAGVINIILKKTVDDGGAFSVYYGQFGQSVGDLPNKYGRTKSVQYHQGWRLGNDGGFLNVSANAQWQNGTNNYPGYKPATLTDRTTLLYPTLADGSLDPRESSVTRYRQWLGLPSSKTYSFAYNTELPLGSDVTLYSNGTYAWRYSSGPGFFRTASNQSRAPGTTPSPQDPFANAPYTSGDLVFPDGYLPTFDVQENDFQAVVGLKGDISGWDWNLSSTYGGDHAKVYTKNSINVSAGPQYWGQRNFYDGAQINGQLLTTLAVSRKLDSGLFGRPLTIAAGVEHRYDSFKKTQGELLSYLGGSWVWPVGTAIAGTHPNLGAQGLSGTPPQSAGSWHRQSIAGYIELNQQLTDKWTVDLSGRFEHFTDFGNAPAGQISTRYEFSDRLALRGSFGNGFSAPTILQQRNTTQSGSYSVDNNPLSPTFGQFTQRATVTTTHFDALGQVIGVPALQPERSINASIGFVAKPFPRTVVTLDGYLIDIKNRIVAASANVTAGTPLANALTAQSIFNVSTITFNINGAHTLTKGFDLRIDHNDPIGSLGTLYWTLTSNENMTSVKSYSALPAIIGAASAGTLRTLDAQFTSYYPKNVTALALRWELDKLNLSIKGTRWSATTYKGATAALDEHQSPAVTVDASLSYAATEWLRFTVGGTNVFNKMPDRISAAAQALQFISGTEVAPYTRYAPFGLDGGFYYARADVKW
jgi:iron complex outermembrane recepter protein